MKTLLFFLLLPVAFTANTQPDAQLAPFLHGVASGDALADKVIIWTRITSNDSTSFTLSWKMATDTALLNVVQQGTATTDSTTDYTVKVDVTGLQPDTWYYYQFAHNGRTSLVGRTKTLPTGMTDRVRFAVASCARYGNGTFYHAYHDIATRNDIHAVVFLGDYIYEGSGSTSGAGVTVLPAHEIVSLQDYRLRYNTYRLDPHLRRAHQQYPFYNVWDDHETTNDSWVGGAEGHNDTTQGNWFARKEAAQRAFFEWLPIRPKAPGSYSIYRSFSIGNLVDLIMIDTRLEGRDKQAAALDQTAYADTNRTLLGTAQRQWLKAELAASQAAWRIIGNQVMFAKLQLGPVAFSYDQWDGYQADRNRIVSHIINNNINNVVIITGDIHTSWANDVPQQGVSYNASTGAGSACVEFVGPSISTGSPVDNSLLGLISATNPHMKYVDLLKSGYMILDIDTARAQSDWYHVSTVSNAAYTTGVAASWYVNSGERFVRQASAVAPAYSNAAAFAPAAPHNPPLGIGTAASAPLRIYPNPAHTLVQLALPATSQVRAITLHDVAGRMHLQSTETTLHVAHLPAGLYFVRVELRDDTMLMGKVVVGE